MRLGIPQRLERVTQTVQSDAPGDDRLGVDLAVGQPLSARSRRPRSVGAVSEVDRDLPDLGHHRDDRLVSERRGHHLDAGTPRQRVGQGVEGADAARCTRRRSTGPADRPGRSSHCFSIEFVERNRILLIGVDHDVGAHLRGRARGAWVTAPAAMTVCAPGSLGRQDRAQTDRAATDHQGGVRRCQDRTAARASHPRGAARPGRRAPATGRRAPCRAQKASTTMNSPKAPWYSFE